MIFHVSPKKKKKFRIMSLLLETFMKTFPWQFIDEKYIKNISYKNFNFRSDVF